MSEKSFPKKTFKDEGDVVQYLKTLLESATKSSFQNLGKNKGEKGSMWRTDGVLKWDNVRLLLEAKFGTDLTKSEVRSNVLAQALYYCKRFEQRGDDIPNVIFIGDDTHCFALPFTAVQKFLDAKVDWTLAPSSPDKDLVIDIDIFLEKTLEVQGEYLKKLCEELAEKSVVKVKPTPKNISAMFQHWKEDIFLTEGKPIEQLDCMLQCIFYREGDSHYVREIGQNKISVSGTEWLVNTSAMRAFFAWRERGLLPTEIDCILSIRDRIIEDYTRRRQGAFYTPTLWVEEAHREIESVLGTHWREDTIVWDCCAGTGNLTRDYAFKNLILSTAEKPDIDSLKRENSHTKAEIFQYDFLNDRAKSPFFETGEDHNIIPKNVRDILQKGASEGKRLVFLINPPYATSASFNFKQKSLKHGVADTEVSKAMRKANLGACTQQLYTQFLFQCEQLADSYGFKTKSMCLFAPVLYMVSGSFKKFRSFWYERYSYQKGFMFKASHFADVKGSWAVSFTIWNEGSTDSSEELDLNLKDLNCEAVVDIGLKRLYNSDNREASEWVSELAPKQNNKDTPKFSSGLKVREVVNIVSKKIDGKSVKVPVPHDKGVHPNGLGVMCNKANNVMKSTTDVFLLSGIPTDKCYRNFDLTEGENWRRAIALYSARRLSKDTWFTHNDEYLRPHTDKEGYDNWVDDCHIYTLLESKNNMVSMRNVHYNGVRHNIHNHFFWLTRAQALDLYNERRANNVYRDAKANPIPYSTAELFTEFLPDWRKQGDPYFASILPTLNLSPLALEIMKDLNNLFNSTLPHRTQNDPVIEKNVSINLHLDAWDAGVYQLKKLWKSTPALKGQWDALNKKHKALASQLESGVYDFGFLKK